MHRFKEAPDKLVDSSLRDKTKGDLKPEAGMSSATSPTKQVQILRKYEEKDKEAGRLTCISKKPSPIVSAGDRILSYSQQVYHASLCDTEQKVEILVKANC